MPIEQLSSLLNRDEGTGVFRPSGTLLRIDVDAVGPARATDSAFSFVPQAQKSGDLHRQLLLRPGEPSPYNALLGAIPPEESDEDFAAAIEAMS